MTEPGSPEGWTVMRLLQTSAKYLGEKGSPSPRLDAEILLAGTLKTTRLKLYTEFDKPVTDPERDAYRAWVKRRAAGEPVAYIVGVKEFYGRQFRVDARVFVPRPETELIVDAVRADYKKDGPWRMLDLGTGSGALAVTLALEFPAATVTAVEQSAGALALAQENAAALGAGDRVRFHLGEWLSPLAGETFDCVVSNPPYVGNHDPDLEPGVKAHEPHPALFSGEDGLDAIRHLAAGLAAVLTEGGNWYCEFGEAQAPALAGLLKEQGWTVKFENDLAGLPRMFRARRQG